MGSCNLLEIIDLDVRMWKSRGHTPGSKLVIWSLDPETCTAVADPRKTKCSGELSLQSLRSEGWFVFLCLFFLAPVARVGATQVLTFGAK